LTRKLISVALCLLLISPAAAADDASQIPSRSVFSMAYSRLQGAIENEEPVSFSVKADVEEWPGMEGDLLSAFANAVRETEIRGTAQTYKDGGGYLDVAALLYGKPLLSLGQMAYDGRVGLKLNDEAVSVDRAQSVEAAAMLTLDDLGKALLDMDYTGLREGNVPFLTAVYQAGLRLWYLAMPYGRDNEYLKAPSGPTSHGITYSIDTQALRFLLTAWADELSRDDFVVGLRGTELSFGVSEAAFDEFVGKIRAFADTVEVVSPITFNMAYGAGDLLQTARGSGTIRAGGQRTSVSYRYTCGVSGTRITRKYSIDFQPRGGDTVVLVCTWLTSSNNVKSGAHEVTLDISGTYDGQPYRVKANSEMVNKFALDNDGILSEVITGKAALSVKYGGVKVMDITVKRNGETLSALEQSGVSIAESFHTTIVTRAGALFKGTVTVQLRTGTPGEMPALYTESAIERLDFSEVEGLRNSLSGALEEAERNLKAALPAAIMQALAGVD